MMLMELHVCHSVDNDSECDLGPPIDLDSLRRAVSSLPTIHEINSRLEACLGIMRTNITPSLESDIRSPKSVGSHGLSQVDSGFGSPPYFIADDDDDDDEDGGMEDDDDNMSGIEPFETSHHELDVDNDYESSGHSLTVAGKSRIGGLTCMSMSLFSLRRRVGTFYVVSVVNG